jgi:hypothetical protein
MNVDQKYPALARLAQSQGYTLEKLALEASPQDDSYLRLCDCCKMALYDWPRWRIDIYHYLATIDKLIRCLDGKLHKKVKLWNKLYSKGLFQKTPSIFLDTVAEAAWGIHFFGSHYEFSMETPFDPADPTSKDADIVLNLEGMQYWLDVLNVEFAPLPTAALDGVVSGSKDAVISELARRAIKKYRDKFKKAILSGPLVGASAGILLCFLKSEQQVIPPILPYIGQEFPPPLGLFSEKNIGLDLVYAYTLAPSNDEYLQPHIYFKWRRQ